MWRPASLRMEEPIELSWIVVNITLEIIFDLETLILLRQVEAWIHCLLPHRWWGCNVHLPLILVRPSDSWLHSLGFSRTNVSQLLHLRVGDDQSNIVAFAFPLQKRHRCIQHPSSFIIAQCRSGARNFRFFSLDPRSLGHFTRVFRQQNALCIDRVFMQ